MLTKDELLKLLRDVESSQGERTVSTSDTDKFCLKFSERRPFMIIHNGRYAN